MKALVIRQPWADLVVDGHKDVENRSWSTAYRGPILILAGKARDKQASWDAGALALRQGIATPAPTVFGAIIGVVDLVDITEGACASKWAEAGKRHWRIANARRFASPIAYTGRLGLFDVPDDVGAAALKGTAHARP